MPKITLIGAGSTVFAKNLLGDILSVPELADAELALFDIAEERLRTSEIVAGKTAAAVGATPNLTATTDRRAALEASDYVVTMFQVGGYRPSTVIERPTAGPLRSNLVTGRSSHRSVTPPSRSGSASSTSTIWSA